jgi:hypothetical protein
MPAEFTADLNPKSNAMSLSDMMKIGLYSAETEIANRRAQIAEQQQKEMPLIKSVMADPENKLPDGSFDIKKISQILPAIAPLTGVDYADKVIGLTKNHIESSKALNELSQQERGILGSIYSAHAAAGTQDPRLVINSLENLKKENPNLGKLVDLKVQALSQIPGGPEFNKKLYQARNETLTPTQVIDQFAPKSTVQQVGNQTFGITTQPSVLGEKPRVTFNEIGGGTQQQPVSPTSTSTTTQTTKPLPKLVQEDTTMNYTGPANPLNLNKFQEEAYKTGKDNTVAANAQLKSQKDLQQSISKVEEYLSSATGSKGLQMIRQGQKWVFGDSNLDSLVKNIAQVQARNAAIMGLDKTDSSRELNAKLSGSENIDPKALAGVMQQVKAESVAAELYTKGLNKFVEKRGDINGFIQAQKFQNKWGEHYDPRIFQVDNIASSNLPEAEKTKQIQEITSKITNYDKYKEDRTIIHRLAKGLYQ